MVDQVSSPPEAGPANPRRPRRFGFTRESRLRKRREFLRVQQHGQRIYGRRLIFQLQPGRAAKSRLGITVSKKVGNAVVRNRIKRWVREAYRVHLELHRDRAAGAHPYDLVVTAKRGVDDFSFHAIEAEMVHVLSRYLENRPQGGRGRRGRGGGRAE
ncbi:MAG: ribonuclease P protein component [Deltaproteobacteria bacterium]|nr:ribonuclease P protein component [Deltaproteobacteria bacterium]